MVKGRYAVLTKVKKARRAAKHFRQNVKLNRASERLLSRLQAQQGTGKQHTTADTRGSYLSAKGKEGAPLCGTVTLPPSAATM